MERRNRQRSPWRWVRWLGVRLLALVAIVTVAITGYHWATGASFSSAIQMLAEDYRLVAACPTEPGRIQDFVARPAPEDGDYIPLSASHGEGWEEEVCDGRLVFKDPDGPEQATPSAELPTPVPTPNLQPEIEAAIEEALGPAAADATVVATATPRPDPVATDSPAGDSPSERHLELKRFMLELINAEREAAGLLPVVLGTNAAAQLHVEASLEGCFSSHWGLDGLKPYMRYSLTGGYQSNGENGSGLDYCITEADSYLEIASIEQEIREVMTDWMESPGHRSNILDPWHRAVNIGLAWNVYNFFAIQHFEGGYVEYDGLPAIEDGHLILAGRVKNGVIFDWKTDLSVQVYYDPPPHPLTRGQLARTYCYGTGVPVAGLRPPPGIPGYYPEDRFTLPYTPCPNPYNAPTDSRAPRSHDEAHAFWGAAYDASQTAPKLTVTVPWITASDWKAGGESFAVKADLSDVLAVYGPGVYSVLLWGPISGEWLVISEYSIFHEIEPPEGYALDR